MIIQTIDIMEMNIEQESTPDLKTAEDLTDSEDIIVSEGIVSNIQRFTIHDGPGIRTEVFLKGCPLRCKWCSNPETIKAKSEIGVYASRCIGIDKCGYCLPACSECDQGVFFQHDNKIVGIDRQLCTDCFKCVDACPANALTVWGKKRSVADVMKIVLSDIEFYQKSGGGVTISGGEALVQWRFTLAILKECRRHKIHTCLETAMHCNPAILAKVFPYTDLVISDLKHMDSSRHKEYTGISNDLIHSNLIRTVEMEKPLIIRIPVVPAHNNSEENIKASAEFIIEKLSNLVIQVQLLPYRQLGVEKYVSLNEDYAMADLPETDRHTWEKDILKLVGIMQSFGIPAVAGANNKLPS